MADLYPTYGRQYQQRQDQQSQYTLAPGSTSSGVMYAPSQLLAQQQQQQPAAMLDDHQPPPQPQQQPSPQNEPSSQSPASQQNGSPKQDPPSPAKADGGMPQQPSKPQATFLTKLYAYVQISLSFSPARACRACLGAPTLIVLLLFSPAASSSVRKTTT